MFHVSNKIASLSELIVCCQLIACNRRPTTNPAPILKIAVMANGRNISVKLNDKRSKRAMAFSSHLFSSLVELVQLGGQCGHQHLLPLSSVEAKLAQPSTSSSQPTKTLLTQRQATWQPV